MITNHLKQRFLFARYEPRRPVPWRGIDVAVIATIYFLPLILSLGVMLLTGGDLHPEAARPEMARAEVVEDPLTEESEEQGVAHPVLDLLRQDGRVGVWLLCILAVVVAAPIAEEFFFRLVLQGWLEAEETRRRRIFRCRALIHGLGPVTISSVLFAGMHYRVATPALEAELLVKMLASGAVWSLFALAFGLVYLRTRTGAAWGDLGVVPDRLSSDVAIGLGSFVVIAPSIYLLQWGLGKLLEPMGIAPDPITLFFFALGLGILYYRTHRIIPSIVLHMALNGCSLAAAWVFPAS